MDWEVEKIEPTQATVALTLAEDAPLGPLSLWLTTSTGVIKPHTFFVDDLDAVNDNGNNHSIETAQQLSTRSTVEGVCDASVSDFYRIHATAGERIAVEVHTQQLRSAMDPVLRLLNAVRRDTDSSRRHCRSVPIAGSVINSLRQVTTGLQIQDSRNSAGGAAYQLRIGDFPVVNQCYPLAVRSGETTLVAFTGPDGKLLAPREIEIPAEAQSAIRVRARFDEGQSSSWVPLYCSQYPQFNETASTDSLTLPIGINGRLEQPREVDSYLIRGPRDKSFASLRKREALAVPRYCRCSCSTLQELRSLRPKLPMPTNGALMLLFPKTATIDWR